MPRHLPAGIQHISIIGSWSNLDADGVYFMILQDTESQYQHKVYIDQLTYRYEAKLERIVHSNRLFPIYCQVGFLNLRSNTFTSQTKPLPPVGYQWSGGIREEGRSRMPLGVSQLAEMRHSQSCGSVSNAVFDIEIRVDVAERLNVLYQKNWTRLVDHELQQLELQVAGAVQAGLAEQDVHWSFFGSLLYSLSVITTIGCGNLGPKTTEGKLATMVYALVGVPLMLICFSHLGSILAELIQSAYSFLCTCSVRRKPNERLELEERRSMPRGLEVVGGGCGRAVCRLTSLESVLDYPSQKAMQHDSDDEDSPIRR
ncbi:unnamed protein product [Nezara viridula]|uniref:Potassium channel domain-containing protein n=1 Tax=Nezara viridula TaxID=85310 RepID=A0A9P0HAU2_NEZVI|nr:unnamed protein product [Nezara viridula]